MIASEKRPKVEEQVEIEEQPLRRSIPVPVWMLVVIVVVMILLIIWGISSGNNRPGINLPTQDVSASVRTLGDIKGELDRLQQEIMQREAANSGDGEGAANVDLRAVIGVYKDTYNHQAAIYNRTASQIVDQQGRAVLENVGLPLKVDDLL